MTIIRCIGCGRTIETDENIRIWAYTCPCGANLFTFDGKVALPISLVSFLAYKKYGELSPLLVRKSIPHLEYYIGYSDYMDDIKKDAITTLRLAGSIPSEECQDIECMREKDRRIVMLQEAIADDYWRSLPDERLAAHFHLSISQIRKIRRNIGPQIQT